MTAGNEKLCIVSEVGYRELFRLFTLRSRLPAELDCAKHRRHVKVGSESRRPGETDLFGPVFNSVEVYSPAIPRRRRHVGSHRNVFKRQSYFTRPSSVVGSSIHCAVDSN